MHGKDARRVNPQIGARGRDRAGHDLEDLAAGLAGLLEGLGQDLSAEALDLDVHLQRGDGRSAVRTLKSMSPR